MGEARGRRQKTLEQSPMSALQTAGGRVQVRWEIESASTPLGQFAYFVEYLRLTGLWSRWLESCPPRYTSPNAPTTADVLGPWMLSILSGHRRYAHVTALRGDGVNPGLLRILDEMTPPQRPPVVRGDADYGVDLIMTALEARGQRYLFKLQLSK